MEKGLDFSLAGQFEWIYTEGDVMWKVPVD